MGRKLKITTNQHEQLPVIEDTWAESEQSTLLDAFVYITRATETKTGFRAHRDMSLDMSDNEALHYLMRRLNMTASQVHLLACVIFHTQSAGNACDMDDLTEYMDSHPLELFSRHADIEMLIEAGYLERSGDSVIREEWTVRREAMVAIRRSMPFDVNQLKADNNTTFLHQCSAAIREGRRHDHDGAIIRQIDWLFKLNQHLPITRIIRRIAGDDELVFKPLILAVALLGAEGADSVEANDFNMMLEAPDINKLVRALQQGKHPLIQQKIFEPFCCDGLANADQWVITKQGWLELLSQDMEETQAIMQNNNRWERNLMPSSQIPERKLFFSGKTEDEVNRLRQLLNDDQYSKITARLKQKNMPTGINILLYGLPGTGKTELVQQLARETGRDIFIVDMSQIRDKYVGQSEQNLAQIFSTYRNYVARMPKTPILFCNECDAIFGSRLERTTGAVDKMENSLQNILLEQMEKLQGIMICTTNLTSTLDKAFERRFLLKLQLPKPNNDARKQIWETMLPNLTDEQSTVLANRFDFSGGQIQNVTRKQIINSIFLGNDDLDFERILDDCKAETMDRTNGRQIGFN